MKGDFVGRSIEDRGHSGDGKGHASRNTLYPYQLELSGLFSDCFRMSLQSGAVFCSSQVIKGRFCQATTSRTLELEFRVYQST